ncbi:MAG TPA: hypothetical protein VMT57_08150 [Candidatus Thermoplasmatota archaeon]|nr:hypothetical protein [Candidatus Thermoplasmatota archaeon]
MPRKKNVMILMTVLTVFILTTTLPRPAVRASTAPISTDFDPLADISITVTIQKIRALDKLDWQVHKREYIDATSDPDFFVKVIINGNEFTSPVWMNQKYIYDPNWSATLNVPDDVEFVNVTIQLWDANETGTPDKICDISPTVGTTTDAREAKLSYSIKTGHWTGDDHLGDASGYGRLNGCDDDSIYQHDLDAELWFNINQTDEDGDGIPYWTEVYQYGTDPTVDNRGQDLDHDGVPIEWEWRYGYDPNVAEAHQSLDADVDGLNNLEEYRTAQWGSDPFCKDLFIELDQMKPSPSGETSLLPQGSKEMLYTAYDRRNIVYHLDDGSWNGTGSEMIPFDNSTTDSELNRIYQNYFLHGDQHNWRLGVFHYGVVIYQSSVVNGNMFGNNRFQISAHGIESKTKIPFMDRDTIYASAYMHETGHTLDIFPIGGHNRFSAFPWQIGWWIWRPYKSCMNYGYMYTTVDYSDGSRGSARDFNDWTDMDLTAFQYGGT